MRIAFISTMRGAPWGGSEALWTAAAQRAAESGHEVFASICPWPETPPQIAALEAAGARIARRTLGEWGLTLWMKRALRKAMTFVRFCPRQYWRELLNFRPDVVCLSQGNACEFLEPPNGLTQILYDWDVPLVIVSHCDPTWRPLSQSEREWAGKVFRRTTVAAFVAERSREITERHIAARIPNAAIVRNPVNMADRSAVSWPPGEEARFAFVGRIETHKGCDILMETLGLPRWRTRPWRLRLYGEVTDRPFYESLLDFYELRDRVEFCGYRQDIRKVWADNHLLVLPSRAESAPLVLVEAMLCGRPAVVTDVGGVSEWLDDGRTGFLCESSAPRYLDRALDRAWQARDAWFELGRAARDKALHQVGPDPAGTFLDHILSAANPQTAARRAA